MTLHQIKKVFVEEKKLMTNKELTILVIKVALAVIGLCLDILMLTMNLLGVPASILVVFGTMLAFNCVFDMIKEDAETLIKVKKFSNLFFVFYALLVVEWLILKYLRFL